MIEWKDAGAKRQAFYADYLGHRLFVQQTLRSMLASHTINAEFQAVIDGVRIDECETLDAAKALAVHAAETKKAPQDGPAGPKSQRSISNNP